MSSITRTIVGSVAVLTCSGRITLGISASLLRDEIRNTLKDGALNIVLALDDVSYMDSAGLGELVSSYTIVRNSHGMLVLCGLQKKIRDLLQITKLNTVFEVFDNVQSALEHLNAESGTQ